MSVSFNPLTGTIAIVPGTSGGSMVYPGAGVPFSTGTAWGTSITGTSSQFIKGDGSLDSNVYLTTSSASSTYARILSGTFTSSSLSSGILTITHSWGLSAPYAVNVTISDNNGNMSFGQTVFSTNSLTVNLSNYAVTGTWGYVVTG